MAIPIFNEEQHKYTTPDGRPLQGVTSILGEFVRAGGFYVNTINGNMIDAPTMDRASKHGTAVHKLFEYSLLYGVGSFDYPPEFDLAVKQINQFIEDCQPKVIMLEQPLYSERWMVAGTPDLFCTMKGQKRICCIDAKTGEGLLTGPQIAAYETLYREHTGEKGLIDRFKLRLPKTGGDYRLIPLKDPSDLKYFEYKLFCRNYAAKLGA